ncbi:hypothetical protein HBH70_029970 [Parastagonospora nodorum]|nr:hypothetical protein HBI10_100360 [Parastagonospora nodorum]KAH4026672.1 hypothetical protein HBI13_065250 [Parastagonospora nodorum]KAH4051856.1 hypothetical protein HBH49_108860 [Parastagonospora nodorum]KAH4167161.1 hypothetical protein HBH43_134010 [Parastagonospora nodorum]KAH4192011.1 hypothetical protein HBH42_116840 [Parastagonospora nodorum]
MHLRTFLCPVLLAASGADALRSGSKVKLSNVQSLTLRKDLETSHRRVSSIPQLKCIGGSGRGHYEIDVMRCKNAGADYDENNIQWTCTASLPEEFKLGSTDVICEGYDYPEDPYILKGSCGVEYRLVLTEKGHEKFGKGNGGWWGGDDDDSGSDGPNTFGQQVAAALFWMAFIGVAGWIIYSAFIARAQGPGAAGGNRPGWGGGGGGGGGGWGGGNDNDGYDDPPPPYYDSRPGTKPGYGTAQPQQQWRPGFWSGAAGGAAATWAANRWANRGNQTGGGSRWNNGGGSSWDNGGEGSSRPSSGSSSFSSTRHESTGFGSTSRR